MHQVSTAYKSEMKKSFRNQGYMMIAFGLINQEAMANATIGGDNFTYFSSKNILNRETSSYIYATLENDFAKVDGSMRFLPREELVQNAFNTGLIGDTIITNTDTADYSMVINLNLEETDIKGLTLDFGVNYAVDFDVITSDGTVFEVRGNTATTYTTEHVFYETTSLTLVFYTMRTANTRVRIYNLLLGVGLYYSNDDIIDSTLESYISPICSDVPQMDFSVTLQNYDKYFNVDNPDSAINFIETGQEMYVYYGLYIEETESVEWFLATKLYCSEWSSDDYEAEISCQDIYRSMDEEYYRGTYSPNGTSLYDLADAVFTDAGIEEYYIDPYLKDIYSKNPLPRVTHKEALQIIANAGRCVLQLDSNGIPQLMSSFEPDYTIAANNETTYSAVENTLESDAKQEYVSLATNYARVDGSMYLLPEDNSNGLFTGYISDSQSLDTCLFETNPILTVTLESQYKYYGFMIRFGGALPAEFIVRTYNDGELVNEVTIGKNSISRTTVYSYEFGTFDVFEIEFTETQEPNNRIVVDYFCFGDITDFTMERADMTSSPKATKGENVKKVEVAYYSYHESSSAAESVVSGTVEATAGDIYNYYLDEAAYGFSATFDGDSSNVEILDSSSYWVQVKFNKTASATLEILANKYNIVTQTATNQINTSGTTVTWENPLIGDSTMASDVAEWVGDYYKVNVEYEYDTRGNPELEANDIIYQENDYVDDMQVKISEYTVGFNGAFSGKAVARRMPTDDE